MNTIFLGTTTMRMALEKSLVTKMGQFQFRRRTSLRPLVVATSGSRSRSRFHTSNVLLGVIGATTTATTTALCEKKEEGLLDKIAQKDKDGNIDFAKTLSQVTDTDFWDKIAAASGDKIQTAYDTGIPSQISYGFVCGFCSGYGLKKIGKGTAVVFGLGFMSLQTLSYYGYVQIDHVRIQADFERAMDLNKDGKVDKEDAQLVYAKIMEVLQHSLPAGGGFAGGFIAGVRSG